MCQETTIFLVRALFSAVSSEICTQNSFLNSLGLRTGSTMLQPSFGTQSFKPEAFAGTARRCVGWECGLVSHF